MLHTTHTCCVLILLHTLSVFLTNFVYLTLSCVAVKKYYSSKLFYFPLSFYFRAAASARLYARLSCLRCQEALAAYLMFFRQIK